MSSYIVFFDPPKRIPFPNESFDTTISQNTAIAAGARTRVLERLQPLIEDGTLTVTNDGRENGQEVPYLFQVQLFVVVEVDSSNVARLEQQVIGMAHVCENCPVTLEG